MYRNSLTGFDAFGRLRVSQPTTLFDSQAQYGLNPLLWETVETAGGTATHSPDDSTVLLETTADGDAVLRQTRQYFRYQPGKSQLVIATGTFGARVDGVTKRIGYFDDDNGVFFEQTGTGLSVVLRSKSSGQVAEDRVPASAWLEYTATDDTRAHIFWFDMEWLGVGVVRAGLVVGGEFQHVYTFRHSPRLATAYMTTANLPLRYEISQAGDTAGALRQICSTVVSEGGFSVENGYLFSASNAGTLAAVTTRRPVLTIRPAATRRPVLTIRPAATLGGIVNRIQILIESVYAYAAGNPGHFEIVYGGKTTKGAPDTAVWSAVNAASGAVFNVDGTTITGGVTLMQFPVVVSGSGVTARGASQASLLSKLPLTLDSAGANPIELAVVATSLNATANCSASVNWREIS